MVIIMFVFNILSYLLPSINTINKMILNIFMEYTSCSTNKYCKLKYFGMYSFLFYLIAFVTEFNKKNIICFK